MRSILDFLTDLAAHNDREWFAANKQRYIAANEIFNGFAAELLAEIQVFDPLTRGLTLRDCTYRIYRDTRFSHDKTPYKTHFGLYICPGGKKSGNPGYYFHVQPVGDVAPGVGAKLDSSEQGVERSGSSVSGGDVSSADVLGGKSSTSGNGGYVSVSDESGGASDADNPNTVGKIFAEGNGGTNSTLDGSRANSTSSSGGANHLMDVGVFMPWPNVLRSVRDEVFDNGKEVLAALGKASAAGFVLDRNNSLTRTPKGFPTATELDDYLRLKDFHTTKPISEEYLLAPNLARRAARDFRTTHEFMSLMQRAAQFAHDENR